MNPNNPFAVLRLPANATAAEIKSAGQLALAKLRLGDAGNVAAIRAVESAIEQLRDPVKRFKLGLEWPSLGPAAAKILATDAVFDDLVSNWRKDRTGIIKQLIAGESTISQQHICSIFHLLRAQELFASILKSDQSFRDDEKKNYLAATSMLFPKGMSLWVTAMVSPEFWMAQRMRAKEINDPRVGADLVSSSERQSFAIAIETFAALATDALRIRNAVVCTAIVNGIQSSGGNRSSIDQILSEIYKPICSRIESAITKLQERLTSTSSKLKATYSDLLAEYIRDIEPDMELLLIVGDLPGTTEERCRDTAAKFLRDLSVASANHADAYEVAKNATILASKVVDSAHFRKMLVEDSEQIDKLAAASEVANRAGPLHAELRAAVLRDDLDTAIKVVDRLLVAVPEHAADLVELRTGLSNKLFNNAMLQKRLGNLAEARRILNSALILESLPLERLIIQRELEALQSGQQIDSHPNSLFHTFEADVQGKEGLKNALEALQSGQSKNGCLIPFALILAGFVGSGGVLVWVGIS